MGKLTHINGLSFHITSTSDQGLDVGAAPGYMGDLEGGQDSTLPTINSAWIPGG
jgi:hypothetical protein